MATNHDVVNTPGVGLDAADIPKQLDLRLAWNFSAAYPGRDAVTR